VDDLLPTALLFLFLATFAFTSVDWRLRRKKLGGNVAPSWDCPHCGLVNEADRTICWDCGAAISVNRFFPEMGPMAADTWRCGGCGAWNGATRRTCWSCSNAPTKQPKRQA
jgi:hypothetical protein